MKKSGRNRVARQGCCNLRVQMEELSDNVDDVERYGGKS